MNKAVPASDAGALRPLRCVLSQEAPGLISAASVGSTNLAAESQVVSVAIRVSVAIAKFLLDPTSGTDSATLTAASSVYVPHEP